MYYSTKNTQKLIKAGASFNLPEKPLGSSYSIKGQYKIVFSAIHDKQSVSKWNILVYDTKNCYSKWYSGGVNQGSITCKTNSSESAIPMNPFGKIENSNYEIQLNLIVAIYINITEKSSGRGRILATKTGDSFLPILSLDESFSEILFSIFNSESDLGFLQEKIKKANRRKV